MKKNLRVFSLFLVSVLMLTGCKKDTSDAAKNNSIIYNGTEYELSAGYLEYYGKVSAKKSYNMDLTLLSSGYTIYEVNGEIDSISGVGNVLYFEVFTSDSSVLDTRTYTFDPLKLREAGSFDIGIVGLNFDVITFDGDYFQMIQGTLKVLKIGSEYELTLSGKSITNRDITGYFKGPLKYYNYGDVNIKKSAPDRLAFPPLRSKFAGN